MSQATDFHMTETTESSAKAVSGPCCHNLFCYNKGETHDRIAQRKTDPLQYLDMDMDKEFKKRKRLTSIVVVTYMFLTGAEYAIIFPSAWAYLQSLGVTEDYMYGFVVAAYSLSMGVAGVLGGRLADIYMNKSKPIVLISVALMAIGNFQYASGINVWNILLSRLLCGVGTAAQSVMTAEICRVTEIEERTPILAVCKAARQFGILISPATQLLFSYCYFRIYRTFEINPLNAPGWFMGVLWIVFCIQAILMYYNLTAEYEKVQMEALKKMEYRGQKRLNGSSAESRALPNENGSGPSVHASSNGVTDEGLERFGQKEAAAAAEARRKRTRTGSFQGLQSLSESVREIVMMRTKSFEGATLALYVEEFLTDVFVLLQSIVFMLYFCSLSFETVIPVIMQEYFDCSIYQISLIYMMVGLTATIIYSVVAFASRHLRDSTLQITGWTLFTAGHIWLLVVIPLCERGHSIHVSFFTLGAFIMFVGYPMTSISTNALTIKVLSEKTQGMGQGMRGLLSSLGMLLGPLWGGSTVKRPYWLMGVPIAVLALNGIMLLASFSHLRKIENEMKKSSNEKKNRVEEDANRENRLLLTK